jgi:hypothetical protein
MRRGSDGARDGYGSALKAGRLRVCVRLSKEQDGFPRSGVSWMPFRKGASSATEMIPGESGRLEETLHVK